MCLAGGYVVRPSRKDGQNKKKSMKGEGDAVKKASRNWPGLSEPSSRPRCVRFPAAAAETLPHRT